MIAVGLPCAGWAYVHFYPTVMQTEQARYRVSVSVETPRGMAQGTGIWGYRLVPQLDLANELGWTYAPRFQGEAIAVPLGDGRTVYATTGNITLARNDPSGTGVTTFNGFFDTSMPLAKANALPSYRPASRRETALAEIRLLRGLRGRRIALDCSPAPPPTTRSSGDCPGFVLLTGDPAKPRIRVIDPDDLAATLGTGYRLGPAKLQFTDAPVTRGISRRLPWAVPQRPTSETWRQHRSVEDDIRVAGFARDDPLRWD